METEVALLKDLGFTLKDFEAKLIVARYQQKGIKRMVVYAVLFVSYIIRGTDCLLNVNRFYHRRILIRQRKILERC
jgi:hypothetical protein